MANSVIERGYNIYDEWNNKKYNSRQIVNSVQLATASLRVQKSASARIQALAYLFALDMRIKYRYKNILVFIFSYFAWRRETELLKWLKGMLNVQHIKDAHDAIEIVLKGIQDNIDISKSDDIDRQTHGGKSVEALDETYKAAKEQQYEKPSDTSEKNFVTEEMTEEYSESLISEKTDENTPEVTKEQAEEHYNDVETSEKTEKASASEEKINPQTKIKNKNNNNNNNKAENNLFDEKSNDNTDKKDKKVKIDENNGYIDVINAPPRKKKADTEKMSFIDEMILDNMIRGKTDIFGYRSIGDTSQDHIQKDINKAEAPQIEKNKDDKDAYLYDEMIKSIKNDDSKEEMPTTKANPNVKEIKSEGNNRFQIKVEESISMENDFRRSVNDQFTDKMVVFHKSLMENALKKELTVLSKEFGIKVPVKIIGASNVK